MKRLGRLHNPGAERGSKTCSKASATGVVGQARRLVWRACLHRKWTGYTKKMILLQLGSSVSWCRWDLSKAKESLRERESTKLAGFTHQAKPWLSQSLVQSWLSVLIAGEDQGEQLLADEQVSRGETGVLLMVIGTGFTARECQCPSPVTQASPACVLQSPCPRDKEQLFNLTTWQQRRMDVWINSWSTKLPWIDIWSAQLGSSLMEQNWLTPALQPQERKIKSE